MLQLRVLLLSVALLVLGLPAHAASVLKTKGNNILMDVDENSLKEGDSVFAVDGNGKKKGLITVKKIKGKKAAGTLEKGIAKEGFTIIPKTAASSSSAKSESLSGPSHFFVGGFAGAGLDSMIIKVTTAGTTETFNTSGTGFMVKAAADYYFSPNFSIRALGGYEIINAMGTAPSALCDSRTTNQCKSELSYLTSELLGRYIFNPGKSQFWAGGGFGFYVPMNKVSNAIAQDSISTASLLMGSFGMDMKIGAKTWLPIQADYSMFFPPGDVTISVIALKVGILLAL